MNSNPELIIQLYNNIILTNFELNESLNELIALTTIEDDSLLIEQTTLLEIINVYSETLKRQHEP